MLQRALEAAGDGYDRIRNRDREKLTYAEWLIECPPFLEKKSKVHAKFIGNILHAGLESTCGGVEKILQFRSDFSIDASSQPFPTSDTALNSPNLTFVGRFS